MFDSIEQFHFIRPFWLLGLIALAIVLWCLKQIAVNQSGWQQVIPPHLAKILLNSRQNQQHIPFWRPLIIGTLIIFALAGPTWQKRAQPVYQLDTGSVLILDMSYSVLATDLVPNRLAHIRYKSIDLLNELIDGEVGLVAYAGDAFVISPLTEDPNNIKLLLPSLSPDIMPELGSYPLAALEKANEMLNNAGHISGNIYWFTDGIDTQQMNEVTAWLGKYNHRVNILGVGTAQGAPITLSDGQLMKDNAGAIVIPKLNVGELSALSKKTSGIYRTITSNNDDIDAMLLQNDIELANEKAQASDNKGDQWYEAGPYLLILALPLILTFFRRGILLSLIPAAFVLTPVKQAHASWWQDLWQTKNQQAAAQFNQQNFEKAAENFNDPMWRGSSLYKQGDFEAAYDAFSQFDSANALYNQGNALAKMQQFEQAIDAYKQALQKQPDHADALSNKALLEKMLEQQKQQQNQQQSDQQQESDKQKSDQQQGEQQDSQNSEQQSDEQQGQQSDSDQSQQSDQEQKSEQESESEENQQGKESDEQKQQQETEEQGESAEQMQAQQSSMSEEDKQKYQQLMRKVTDDPYLLLRNKMQLEYQKRRQNRSVPGAKKKW